MGYSAQGIHAWNFKASGKMSLAGVLGRRKNRGDRDGVRHGFHGPVTMIAT
jgi:hypothetical protein